MTTRDQFTVDSEATVETLTDQINDRLLDVDGVHELYPPHHHRRPAAFTSTTRTAELRADGSRTDVTARLSVTSDRAGGDVARDAAAAIRAVLAHSHVTCGQITITIVSIDDQAVSSAGPTQK
ncbi:hypothetical protein [Tersicoccus sp. Bi-70]|uniref:hypothetical protein n=1 Tax=Tersicoccus sp. Bi-70 TaxID=1897634 RepID=UPI000977DA49|nr:hypothetical protein [Tersicoccus sp. Bi-70]OMH34077.1 hypothetical protein BGP79_02600 [Tersicoccus sp. Bi-70]